MDTTTTIRSCVFLEKEARCREIAFEGVKKTGFFSRLRGLIAQSDSRVYVFENCSSIHTIGMQKPIDVAFLSHSGEVMKVVTNLVPFRFAHCLGAYTTMERLHSHDPWFEQNQQVNYEKYSKLNRKDMLVCQN